MSNNILFRCFPFFKLILSISLIAGCASTPDELKIEKPVFPPPPNPPRIHYQQSLVSSADVEIEDRDSAFKRMITGQARSGIGMGKPFGVTVHQGRVFVSDTVKRMVIAFDKPQGKFMEIGTRPPGELLKPMGLDVDNEGNLYVCDASQKHVVVFDRDGNYLRTIGQREDFSRPAGLTVDPEGNRVFKNG